MTIQITEEDIEGSERYDINNPFLYALQRTTGTLWLISDCGVVQEVTPPYRSFILSQELLDRWQHHKSMKSVDPFEFEANFENVKEVS